jgi:hypothetical protein
MKFQVSHTALALFFGAALIATPAMIGAKGLFSHDQAFAGPGKSGDHGGGNGNGKGGGKGKKAAAAEEEEDQTTVVGEEPKNKKGKLASKLGALNAYHASPNAFKNASPNSRVGRIAAYWDKLQEAEVDGKIDETEQAELDRLLDAAANKPIDPETREAFDQMLRDKFGDDAGDDEGDGGEEETE